MKNNMVFLVLLLAALFASACDPINGELEEFAVKGKTVLVYMVGNNNLSSDASNNIRGIRSGYVPEEDNLLVYYHTQRQDPVLIKIFKDAAGAVQEDTVYRFPPRNSSTAESLKSAMQVTRTMFPAEEYGLFLWSHGTGWLPQGHYSTRSFGAEEGLEIELKDLVKAFPYRLSFVLFDACLMGGIEVAYQMKDSVDYVVSSPAEILAEGFPYSKVMKHIFKTPMDLQAVAEEYFTHYDSKSGDYRSATISMVKTSALEEVAQAVKPVFEKYSDNIKGMYPGNIQCYNRFGMRWFFDFGDFISNIATADEAAPVLEALDKAVIYKAATPYFIEMRIDPQKYSGLSTYIPVSPEEPQLDDYYRTLEWNKAVGMIK